MNRNLSGPSNPRSDDLPADMVVCVHTYKHIQSYSYIPTHTHIHTHAHTHIHTCTRTHIHTCTHTHKHTYTHTHIHSYTQTHIHTYTHTQIHTCTNTRRTRTNFYTHFATVFFLPFFWLSLWRWRVRHFSLCPRLCRSSSVILGSLWDWNWKPNLFLDTILLH